MYLFAAAKACEVLAQQQVTQARVEVPQQQFAKLPQKLEKFVFLQAQSTRRRRVFLYSYFGKHPGPVFLKHFGKDERRALKPLRWVENRTSLVVEHNNPRQRPQTDHRDAEMEGIKMHDVEDEGWEAH